jgi:hypothetical protein
VWRVWRRVRGEYLTKAPVGYVVHTLHFAPNPPLSHLQKLRLKGLISGLTFAGPFQRQSVAGLSQVVGP